MNATWHVWESTLFGPFVLGENGSLLAKCEYLTDPYLQIQGGCSSVRFGYRSCIERFDRFGFSVPTVPLGKGFLGTSVEV